jgi:hypothetical protein
MDSEVKKDRDFYTDKDGNTVFTREYHLARGHCCQSGCAHCPYGYNGTVDPNIPQELRDPDQDSLEDSMNYDFDIPDDL